MEMKEIRDLAVAAVVLSAVFAFEGFNPGTISRLPEATLGVTLGFLLHELSHRFFARRYKCHAEFHLWRTGLILAVLFALVSNGAFVFAAPGAVVIYEAMDVWGNVKPLGKKRYGIVSIAGPVTNVILAGIFFAANKVYPSSILAPAFTFALTVNIWIAIFNMLPVPPLDGSKVFAWDKKIWAAFFAFLIVVFYFALQFL